MRIQQSEIEGRYLLSTDNIVVSFDRIKLLGVRADLFFNGVRVATVYGDTFKCVKQFWSAKNEMLKAS